jgi:Type II secretion system protein C
MTGRRLISGLAGAWAVASPGATRGRLAGAARNLVASWMAALLGRVQLPGMGELAALRPPTRALLVGFTGWIVLVVLVTLAAVVSLEMSAVSMPEWLGVPSSASRVAAVRSPVHVEDIVQRPLFARSRQGTVQAAVPLQALPPSPATLDRDVTLKGVFISGSVAKAFLLSRQNPLGLWVQAGEDIAGWNVMEVQPDQVILQGEGEKWVVQRNVGGAK